MLNLKAEHSHLSFPQDALKRAADKYYPDIDWELYCEPFGEAGKPYWAFDNFRTSGSFNHGALYVFYTQPSWGNYFSDRSQNTKCVTYAADEDVVVPQSEREYDLGFIGQLTDDVTDRGTQINYMKEKFNCLFSDSTPSNEIGSFYSKCRVIFNPQRTEEINIRFFEGLQCGIQVVRYSPVLHLFAIEGEHYLSYRTLEEAQEKITWLLNHPKEAEQMRYNASTHVLKSHTYKQRAEEMLRFIGKL